MAPRKAKHDYTSSFLALRPALSPAYALNSGVFNLEHLAFSKIIRLPGNFNQPPDGDEQRAEIRQNICASLGIIDGVTGYFNCRFLPNVTACENALGDTDDISDLLRRSQSIARKIKDRTLETNISVCIDFNSTARQHVRILGEKLRSGRPLSSSKHSELAENFDRNIKEFRYMLSDLMELV